MKKIIKLLLVSALTISTFSVKAHDAFLKNDEQTFVLKTNVHAETALISPEDKDKGEMIIGEKIDYIFSFWKVSFSQKGRRLNARKMIKTLKTIDVCKKDMKDAVKYMTLRSIFTPLIIVAVPVFLPLSIIYGNKANNSLKKAIDEYNDSLK